MAVIGVYKIESILNGRIYIGSSVNVLRRWRLHKSELLNNKHHSIILQRHVNKYGLEDLVFSLLEETHEKIIIEREQHYIDLLKPFFNIRKVADSNIGIKRSIETKEKLRLINLGKKLSDTTKQKMADRMYGNAYSKNITPVNAKKIICTKTGIEFSKIEDAAIYVGLKRTTLNAQLSGQNTNKTSLKYI